MNARNLMLNVVIFEFTFIRTTLFVTNVHKMNEFKKIEGQAWSAWKKFLEENKLSDNAREEHIKKKYSSKETASCMKLPRSDMALFGLCPKTELFELVVCNYCGSKFKLAAFADHIRTRHSDTNVTSPKTLDNKLLKVDNNVQKKGKNKKTKDKIIKPKEKIDAPAKTEINLDVKVDLMDKQTLSSECEHSSKIKQINVKLKKNCKSSDDSSKEESKSSDNVLKPEPVDDKVCNGSDDANTLKSQQEDTTTTQEAEKVNLQPVVQLIPLSTSDILSDTPPAASIPIEETKVVPEIQENNTIAEKTTTNNQQFCISDKDNSKASPILQNLPSDVNSTVPVLLTSSSQSCSKASLVLLNSSSQSNLKSSPVLLNSYSQSNSIPNPVPLTSSSPSFELTNSGKGKSLDVTVGEKNREIEVSREIPIHNEVSSCSNLENDNKQPISNFAGTSVKSHILVNHKINKTEGMKVEHKQLKRITSDRPRLSLPVSIKNPTLTNSILSQLQNKVIQSKFSLPIEVSRNDSIQEVIKENFVQKHLRNARIIRSKENSKGEQNPIKKEEDSESSEVKTEESKVEGFMMLYPGCRRSGGLLTSNHNLPRINPISSKTKNTASSMRKEELNSSTYQSNLSNYSERNEIINLVVSNVSNKNDNNNKKIQLEIDYNMKRPSLQNKQKLKISNSTRKTNSQQHKIIHNQKLNNSKTVICKRLNNNTNGAVPAKMKRQEGLINIVGSVFTKSERKLPLMHVELPNNVLEKKILPSSQHITTTNAVDISKNAAVPSGVEVISGNILRTTSSARIGTPRIHYFTSSGPLPVTASPASIQQLQLKQMRLQHKYHLLNPQINMVPAGNMFIITKSTTNSSLFNGIEEK